jgi:hypothetical protein
MSPINGLSVDESGGTKAVIRASRPFRSSTSSANLYGREPVDLSLDRTRLGRYTRSCFTDVMTYTPFFLPDLSRNTVSGYRPFPQILHLTAIAISTLS